MGHGRCSFNEGLLIFFTLALTIIVIVLRLSGEAAARNVVGRTGRCDHHQPRSISVRGADNLFIPYACFRFSTEQCDCLRDLSGWIEGILFPRGRSADGDEAI